MLQKSGQKKKINQQSNKSPKPFPIDCTFIGNAVLLLTNTKCAIKLQQINQQSYFTLHQICLHNKQCILPRLLVRQRPFYHYVSLTQRYTWFLRESFFLSSEYCNSTAVLDCSLLLQYTVVVSSSPSSSSSKSGAVRGLYALLRRRLLTTLPPNTLYPPPLNIPSQRLQLPNTDSVWVPYPYGSACIWLLFKPCGKFWLRFQPCDNFGDLGYFLNLMTILAIFQTL